MKTIKELLNRLEYSCICGAVDREITQVVYDSRKIVEGCLFICIKGANFNGHDYAAEACEKMGVNYRVGNILSSDMFYDDANSGMQWAKMGVLGVEMESAALYCNAARAGKKALCICSVSDSFIYKPEDLSADVNQHGGGR